MVASITERRRRTTEKYGALLLSDVAKKASGSTPASLGMDALCNVRGHAGRLRRSCLSSTS
jgi:hypothetical protein